jgi:tRNA threonylcarbamoyladenosine biosynthesis protein TsaB
LLWVQILNTYYLTSPQIVLRREYTLNLEPNGLMAKQAAPQGPYFLAIETATSLGSVALYAGPSMLGYLEYRKAKSHARLLGHMVQTLLTDLEIPTEELSAIAVSQGPGSYTGLRVGVSTAKGLCMALDKPLIGISSLEALAWQVQELAEAKNAWICPMIDARRMEVYCQLFNEKAEPMGAAEALVIDENAFQEVLKAHRVIFVGDGAAKCQPLLGSQPSALFLPGVRSSASHLGKALHQKYLEEDFEDLVRFEPFYLKSFRATRPKNPLL